MVREGGRDRVGEGRWKMVREGGKEGEGRREMVREGGRDREGKIGWGGGKVGA